MEPNEQKKETIKAENKTIQAEEQKPEEPQQNVKCSFCGNDAFCSSCVKDPEHMDDFEHMCYDCYMKMGENVPENVREKTHVIIPPDKMAEQFQKFLDQMTGRAFSELWAEEKAKLREMSKQELAQIMYFEGARFMFDFMQRMSAEDQHEGHGHETHAHEGDEHEAHGHEEHEGHEAHEHKEHEGHEHG